MTTAAGTILPSKVFIIGVGVAGLQAIATAKRLGAKVTAYDTRPVVEEQVKSLGAQFLKIDIGETGQTKEGYAKALTEEQIQKQRDAMRKTCGDSDVVITTAQVFGRKAPVLVTADMLNAMKPGSVVIDMAVETGGNVEGVVLRGLPPASGNSGEFGLLVQRRDNHPIFPPTGAAKIGGIAKSYRRSTLDGDLFELLSA